MVKWYLGFYKNPDVKKVFWKVMFLIVVSSLLNCMVPIITKNLISPNITQTNVSNIVVLIISFIFISLASYLLERYHKYQGHRFGYNVERYVRDYVFEKILNLDIEYINTKKRGEIGALITNDASNLGEFSYHIFANVVEAIFSLIIGVIVMSTLSLNLTIMIMIYIVISQSIGFLIGRSRKKVFQQINEQVGTVNGVINEQIDNLLLIKTMNKQSEEEQKFKVQNEVLYNLYVKAYKLLANFISFTRFTTNLLTFIIILFGSYLMLHNQLQINVLISFVLFAGYLTDPIKTFLNLYEMIINAQSNIGRLYNFINVESKIEKNEVCDFESGDIEFNNLTFKYEENEIFKDFNLTIKENSNIAIIGESGSGKTTLINLLQRKFKIDAGNISINGTNINDIKWASFKENIAVISQSSPVLNGTLEDNIKYGIENVSEQDYNQALKFAHLQDFVSNLENKDQSIINEDGSNISGGQRQRIAIARAILKKSKILIFDEATSALDNSTEKIILENIEKLNHKVTIITIAHRLTTVTNCDEIIMVNKGKIVTKGKHKQLLESNELYKEMFNMYKGEQDV